jgi:hypothetical protein
MTSHINLQGKTTLRTLKKIEARWGFKYCRPLRRINQRLRQKAIYERREVCPECGSWSQKKRKGKLLGVFLYYISPSWSTCTTCLNKAKEFWTNLGASLARRREQAAMNMLLGKPRPSGYYPHPPTPVTSPKTTYDLHLCPQPVKHLDVSKMSREEKEQYLESLDPLKLPVAKSLKELRERCQLREGLYLSLNSSPTSEPTANQNPPMEDTSSKQS